ncbi:MAG: COG3014 family protein, partial [Planctomycetota bacterium]
EFRIDLPLFIATDNIRYVGIALPMLTFRQAASPYLEIKAGSKTSRTQLVADMDRVIHTEFEKDFKGTLTRAIISTTTKAIAQYALEKNSGSSWASVAMAVYSFVTTAADVRIWTALPKNFQAARLTIPENGILNVSGPNLMPIQVEIGDCNYAIVYVKMINAAHQPSIEIMTF